MRTLALLLALLCSQTLLAADYNVPLLEFRQEAGNWAWFRDGKQVEADTTSMTALFRAFAAHTDAKAGWKGRDNEGLSDNLLVVNTSGGAPTDLLGEVLCLAREAGIKRIALASAEEIKTAPAKTKAPDAAKLDAAYVLLDTQATARVEPPAKKETITVYCNFDETAGAGNFGVGINAAGREPVGGSNVVTSALVFEKKEKAAARKSKAAERARMQKDLAAAIEARIASAGTPVEVVEITNGGDSTPWVFEEIAGRAVAAVIAASGKAGGGGLEIRWALLREDRTSPEELNALSARTLAALEWLKDHQGRDGSWTANGFSDDTTRSEAKRTFNIEFVKPGDKAGDQGWNLTGDIGLTGLALLAFCGAGYDHKEGDYRAACRQAILYLRKVQDNDGCFGAKKDDHFVYNHAICTMAMAQIYGLSGDQVIKPIADKACEFVLKAQNPGLGWRYGVQPGVNDTSVTTWMVMALKSAKLAGIDIDTTKSYTDAAAWFKTVTVNVDDRPKCGYDSPGSSNARLRSAQEYHHNPTMNAMYMVSMLFMGKADTNDKSITAMSRELVEKGNLPAWDHYKIDFYYWHYATLALYQVGGSAWRRWEKSLTPILLDHQRGYCTSDTAGKLTTPATLDEHGSWDAVDAWGGAGGRVYATAISAITLETITRAKRLK